MPTRNLLEKIQALTAENARLRAALDKAIGAYHVIRSMAHDYAKAGGAGPEIRDWNEGERLILEAELAELKKESAEAHKWQGLTLEAGRELEAQLAEAKERNLIYANALGERDATITLMRRAQEKAEADAARLRDVLTKVEEWFASECGPIYQLWDDLDICNYDNRECEWEETLAEVRDFNIPADCLGYGTEWPEVTLYREILVALRPDDEQPAAAESEGE